MGDFVNYIGGKSVKDVGAGITITSTVHGGFKPGQDGDTGNIKVFYGSVHHPEIGIKRGYWVEKFVDNPDLDRKADRSVYTSTYNANYLATINTVQLQFKNDQARGLEMTKNTGLTVCTGGGVTIFHTCT